MSTEIGKDLREDIFDIINQQKKRIINSEK